MSEWNQKIITEFRENEGKVGGVFDGWDLLLLHHQGARSGTRRVTPLAYQPVDAGYAVFASKGGSDTNPDWYHNLLANPEVDVEVGEARVRAKARLVNGGERERIWSEQKRRHPQFADYEEKTARDEIPVFVLEES